jgi:hypothetical protein
MDTGMDTELDEAFVVRYRAALSGIAAFHEFQRDGDARREAPPETASASVVGEYQS